MEYRAKKATEQENSSLQLSTYVENPIDLDGSLDQDKVYGSSCGGGCYGCGGCAGCGGCRVTPEMLEAKISEDNKQRNN